VYLPKTGAKPTTYLGSNQKASFYKNSVFYPKGGTPKGKNEEKSRKVRPQSGPVVTPTPEV